MFLRDQSCRAGDDPTAGERLSAIFSIYQLDTCKRMNEMMMLHMYNFDVSELFNSSRKIVKRMK